MIQSKNSHAILIFREVLVIFDKLVETIKLLYKLILNLRIEAFLREFSLDIINRGLDSCKMLRMFILSIKSIGDEIVNIDPIHFNSLYNFRILFYTNYGIVSFLSDLG